MEIYVEHYTNQQRNGGYNDPPYGFVLILFVGALSIVSAIWYPDWFIWTILGGIILTVIYAGLAAHKAIDWAFFDRDQDEVRRMSEEWHKIHRK
jgi:hypothetical protein